MLVRLLLRFLRPHRGALLAVVLLQTVATGTMLILPALNADLIDYGVARGDIAHRVEKGGVQPVLVERKHEAAPAAGKEHDFVEFGAGQARDGGQPVGDRDDRASLLGRRAETGGFDARP